MFLLKAMLRMKSSYSKAEKYKRVDEVLNDVKRYFLVWQKILKQLPLIDF